MEKDIKYLSSHQNFLNLDDTQETLHLKCTYKLPKVRKGSVFSPWESCTLPLSRLQFDGHTMQAYFFDFNTALARAEKEAAQQRLNIAKEKGALERYESNPEEDYWHFEEQEIEKQIKESVENVIRQISYCKQNGFPFRTVEDLTEAFTEFEWESLNERIGFSSKRPKGKSLISHYIAHANKADWPFIQYLLNETHIEIDMSPGVDGITILQEILQNDLLPAKPVLIPALFQRGYQLEKSDEDAIIAWEIRTGKMLELPLYRIFNRLHDRSMVSLVKYHTGPCYVLESARLQTITRLRFANWIGLVNHAITTYKSHWSFIERALRYYQVWPIIMNEDKKRTFDAKLIRYRDELPEQDSAFNTIFKALFPEIQ